MNHTIIHWSDCAIYNEPAFPAGPCDCGAAKAQKKWWTYLYHLFSIRVSSVKIRLGSWIGRLFCQLSSFSNPALCPKNYPRELNNNGVLRFQRELYRKRDLTPEHTKRSAGNAPLVQEVLAAYRYVDSVVDVADLKVSGAPAWHGWALREAFLAGVSHARVQDAQRES